MHARVAARVLYARPCETPQRGSSNLQKRTRTVIYVFICGSRAQSARFARAFCRFSRTSQRGSSNLQERQRARKTRFKRVFISCLGSFLAVLGKNGQKSAA